MSEDPQSPPCRKPWRYDAGLCNWPDCGCDGRPPLDDGKRQDLLTAMATRWGPAKIPSKRIDLATDAFWNAIPVGALLEEGACDWIAHGLSVALATYGEAPTVEPIKLAPPGPYGFPKRAIIGAIGLGFLAGAVVALASIVALCAF